MAWDNAVVTNNGVAMLQQVLAGGVLTLDGAAGGAGTVPASSLMAQTALSNQKQSFVITGATNVSNGKKISIQITSVGLLAGYTMKQVGIWAHVGNNPSVLFAIIQDSTGIAIPSEAELPDFAMNFYAVINFSNESSFSLTVDASALVTLSELNERLTNVETPEGAQAKADVVQGNLDEHSNDLAKHKDIDLKLYRMNKDSEGVFTELQWKRADDTLAIKSVLSGGTSPKYTTRTETYYDEDGETVKRTKIYALAYDEDDDLISEV